ncbi:MAG: ribosomal protein S18-alanine N-acetyltransferase [Acidobacteriota bacterium]|nr:MAG: ribosomal protein S18-alanine N-acetyltransferase [Acidobacteriota bacterium]
MTDFRPVSIERMGAGDVAEVVSLEVACNLNSRGTDAYLAALDDPQEMLLVARAAGETVGLFSARLVVDELQIDNIAVASCHRRSGIASRLLAEALATARLRGARLAVLEVRASNTDALTLYRKAGFTAAGSRKSYYHNPHEDALVLTINLV